jgi:hypothetical protein
VQRCSVPPAAGPTGATGRAGGPLRKLPGTVTCELPPQLLQPGLGTISDDYGPAAFRRSKDLAAAAGARATRMSRLRAGDAAGGRGLGASPCDGTYDDHATAGAGQGVSPGARPGLGVPVQCRSTRRGMCWVFIILTSRSFFLGEPSLIGRHVLMHFCCRSSEEIDQEAQSLFKLCGCVRLESNESALCERRLW